MRIESILLDEKEQSDVTAYIRDDYSLEKNELSPAVIICPGGGWFSLSEREGEPVALAFLNEGFQAFVLHYSKEDDLDKTIQILLKRKEEFRIDVTRIVLVGFSAGAQLAALYGNKCPSNIRAVVLSYPLCDTEIVHAYMNSDAIKEGNRSVLEKVYSAMPKRANPIEYIHSGTPPTFIWHTADDALLPVGNVLNYANQLAQYHVSFELHIYEQGVHGLSLGKRHSACVKEEVNPHCAAWFQSAIAWLKEGGVLNEENSGELF